MAGNGVSNAEFIPQMGHNDQSGGDRRASRDKIPAKEENIPEWIKTIQKLIKDDDSLK